MFKTLETREIVAKEMSKMGITKIVLILSIKINSDRGVNLNLPCMAELTLQETKRVFH